MPTKIEIIRKKRCAVYSLTDVFLHDKDTCLEHVFSSSFRLSPFLLDLQVGKCLHVPFSRPFLSSLMSYCKCETRLIEMSLICLKMTLEMELIFT